MIWFYFNSGHCLFIVVMFAIFFFILSFVYARFYFHNRFRGSGVGESNVLNIPNRFHAMHVHWIESENTAHTTITSNWRHITLIADQVKTHTHTQCWAVSKNAWNNFKQLVNIVWILLWYQEWFENVCCNRKTNYTCFDLTREIHKTRGFFFSFFAFATALCCFFKRIHIQHMRWQMKKSLMRKFNCYSSESNIKNDICTPSFFFWKFISVFSLFVVRL